MISHSQAYLSEIVPVNIVESEYLINHRLRIGEVTPPETGEEAFENENENENDGNLTARKRGLMRSLPNFLLFTFPFPGLNHGASISKNDISKRRYFASNNKKYTFSMATQCRKCIQNPT